jgi:hypothetical protein
MYFLVPSKVRPFRNIRDQLLVNSTYFGWKLSKETQLYFTNQLSLIALDRCSACMNYYKSDRFFMVPIEIFLGAAQARAPPPSFPISGMMVS